MKIAIDARMVNMSGIGRYLTSLLRIILTDKQNSFVLLGKPDELSEFEKSSNVNVIEVNSRIYSPLEHLELMLKIPRCDIYFSPHFLTPILPIRAGSRITTIHDLFHLSEIADFGLLKRMYLKLLYRNAAVKSRKIITVSRSSEEILHSLFPFTKSKTEVIYNSVDSEFFRENVPENNMAIRYALYVGNIKPHKNLSRLVRVFNGLEREDFFLVIIGDREGFLNGIDDFEETLSGAENVIFTGKVTDWELKGYYTHADFLIFPSLYEGFGYPPLEAMACGTAAACSSISVIREICGDAVLYFDPLDEKDMGEKISLLIENPELRDKLVKKGVKAVAKYDVKSFAEAHRKIFTSP